MVTSKHLDQPIELDSAAFALRLANMLRHQRRVSGRRLRSLARSSEGRFSAAQLKAAEAGRCDPADAVELAALYGADLSEILPERLPLVVDVDGRISAAAVSENFTPGDETDMLSAYLRLVRRLRREQRAALVDLRRDDVEVLAATLQVPGETVVAQLAALMGATKTQRRVMVGLFVAGAAVIGLTVTTVVASSDGTGQVSTSSTVEISVPMVTVAPAPVVEALTTGTPTATGSESPVTTVTTVQIQALHEELAYLETNGLFIMLPWAGPTAVVSPTPEAGLDVAEPELRAQPTPVPTPAAVTTTTTEPEPEVATGLPPIPPGFDDELIPSPDDEPEVATGLPPIPPGAEDGLIVEQP